MDIHDITVVINTFQSHDKIEYCIKSIHPKIDILIVENSDNTEFQKKIEKKFTNVKCFLTGENLGYAKGNNFGLSKVKTTFALILNPDATLEKNTIINFFDVIKKIEEFAILGPAKQDELSLIDENKNKEDIFEVNYLKGFAMFLNLKEFKDIGFFDDNFFIYLEEIDLCKRLKQKNKKIFLCKNIKVNHLGGSSHNKDIDFEMELSRNWHWMWSTFYFNKKHYGFLKSLAKVSGKLISTISKVILYSLVFNNKKKQIYLHRCSGLYNSIIGRNSWYRPKI